ncbi:MAG TPA: M64 family metallopeptidase [Planctomycetota bacterium]|nr:M64 family metallopeptidase [Planctomycetota bacterium]
MPPLRTCPRCRTRYEAKTRHDCADAQPKPDAKRVKPLLLWGSAGGGAVVLAVVAALVFSGPSAPPPTALPAAKAPGTLDLAKARRDADRAAWERAKAALEAARGDLGLADEAVAALEAILRKAPDGEIEAAVRRALAEAQALLPSAKVAAEVRGLVEAGKFRGAATLVRGYLGEPNTAPALKASLEALQARIAKEAPARWEALLAEAKALPPERAREVLLDATAWGVPEIEAKAKAQIEALGAAAVAPAPPPAPAPGPAKPAVPQESLALPAPAADPRPAAEPAAPPPPLAGKTETSAGPGVKILSVRGPRKGEYAPGGLSDADKAKKHGELAAEVRKEKRGAAKAAAAQRAEWLSTLEKEMGIYDVATIADRGDVARRVDVVIVSSGFPKADAKKVNGMAEQLKTSLLKVDPFRNYPDYINFHRINVDDAGTHGRAKIPFTVQQDILTCDRQKALEYARIAPSFDLVVVLCNVANVRATGGPPLITIDASLDMGRTFLHEMGHAFAGLSDEYVDPTLAPGRPFVESDDNPWLTNVTAQSDPKKAKWHYWTLDLWPAAHEMNRLPKGHRVGAFEGAAYQAKGVFRPEAECLMRMGTEYCVVCFEHVEKRFYRLIAPIDDARPRAPKLGLWLDDTAVLEGDAIRTVASGSERIGKFEAMWYVDGAPRSANSKNLTTTMTLPAAQLGAGVHEAALRVDFSNRRVRRDDGWLSSSIGWRLEVAPHKKPKWQGPDKVQGRVGQPLTFEAKIENPDPQAYRIEVHALPEGATYENGTVAWTPSKAQQGGWRPRFVLTDGLRAVERAVEVAVLDVNEKNFEPLFSPMEAVAVKEGDLLELPLAVTDVDGDNLVFTSANLPEGAELDVYDGVIRWKPGPRQAGRYPGIAVEVFDGRRKSKGAVEIVVDDRPGSNFSRDDLLNGLRSPSDATRKRALEELGKGDWAKGFHFMEAARLLRDKDEEVRAAALGALQKMGEDAEGPFLAMMIKDLTPHAWHFTDHAAVLEWLGGLAGKGAANDPHAKALKTALKLIERYNKDRGL